jgi:hypothetical protein
VTIDITGLDKAAVLTALYDRARPRGIRGRLRYRAGSLSEEETQAILSRGRWDGRDWHGEAYIDLLHGRVVKMCLLGDAIGPLLYDRYNGEGAAAEVIDRLRSCRSDVTGVVG